MAVTEAKRRSNRKWDAENMTNISCRVKKTDADRYRAAAAAAGTSVNAVLREALEELAERTGMKAE